MFSPPLSTIFTFRIEFCGGLKNGGTIIIFRLQIKKGEVDSVQCGATSRTAGMCQTDITSNTLLRAHIKESRNVPQVSI